MKIILTTLNGLENITIEEIWDKLKIKAKKIIHGRIQIETNKPPINLRSIISIYELINIIKFKTQTDLLSKIKKLKFDIEPDFVVRVNKDNKNIKKSYLEAKIGEIIHKQGNKVNLKSQNIVIADIIKNICILGKLIKKDLHKRTYRIRINNRSITPLLAYFLVRFSDTKKTDIILDPFCKDGVIPLEASTEAKKVYAIDNSLNNIRNTQINAKLAKADIEIRKAEIDWLDTLFQKKTIDKIITNPPFLSKTVNGEIVEKQLKELFYQSRYVLKGTLNIITPNPDLIKKLAKERNFSIKKQKKVVIGATTYYFLQFKNQKNS